MSVSTRAIDKLMFTVAFPTAMYGFKLLNNVLLSYSIGLWDGEPEKLRGGSALSAFVCDLSACEPVSSIRTLHAGLTVSVCKQALTSILRAHVM